MLYRPASGARFSTVGRGHPRAADTPATSRGAGSADLARAPQLFLKLQAPVLVLACRDLDKAEQFYLGIYREGAERKFRVHPHRTILLCGKDDVRKAYELCRSGVVDDYVQFWPMTYDAHRLACRLHRAMLITRTSFFAAARFRVQARQLAQLEELLSESLQAGAGHAAAAGTALNNAETSIGHALNGLAMHLLHGGSVTLTRGNDANDLARHVGHFSETSVLPHVRAAGREIAPLHDWVQAWARQWIRTFGTPRILLGWHRSSGRGACRRCDHFRSRYLVRFWIQRGIRCGTRAMAGRP